MRSMTLRGGPLDGVRVRLNSDDEPVTVAVQGVDGRMVAVDSPYSSTSVGRRARLGVTVRVVTYAHTGDYRGLARLPMRYTDAGRVERPSRSNSN